MKNVSGVSGAGPIWHKIVEYMIQRGFITEYKTPIPHGVYQKNVCRNTLCTEHEFIYTKNAQRTHLPSVTSPLNASLFFGSLNDTERETWNITP